MNMGKSTDIIKETLKKMGFSYDSRRKLWLYPRGHILEDEFLEDIDSPDDLKKLLAVQTRILTSMG